MIEDPGTAETDEPIHDDPPAPKSAAIPEDGFPT
jgi:hypothetical protein